MSARAKQVFALVLLLIGAALIGWYATGGGHTERGMPASASITRILTVDQVPSAVRDTLQRESAGCTVAKISEKTREVGKITYKVAMLRGDKKFEVEIADDGRLLHRPVTLEQVAPAARAIIEHEATGGSVDSIVEIHGDSDKITYDVDVIVGDTKTALMIEKDGTVASRKSRKIRP